MLLLNCRGLRALAASRRACARVCAKKVGCGGVRARSALLVCAAARAIEGRCPACARRQQARTPAIQGRTNEDDVLLRLGAALEAALHLGEQVLGAHVGEVGHLFLFFGGARWFRVKVN